MNYTNNQLAALVILRILIGWHLLYEGLVKLINPYWTSAQYLQKSQGILSGLFQWLVENAEILILVDFINIWALILLGVALIAGIGTRIVCLSGMLLIFIYYSSNPPFIGMVNFLPTEGNYLIVDKNLIEISALFVLYLFPTGQLIGLDRFISIIKTE